jgi:hypothetical protein
MPGLLDLLPQVAKAATGLFGVKNANAAEPSSGNNSVVNHFFNYVKPAELSPGTIEANPGKYVTQSGTGYNVYKDTLGVFTYGPGVVKNQDLVNRYNRNFNTEYTLKDFPPSIDLQFVDNVAMDRWRNSVNSAAKMVGKDNPALLITAEMFYQLGNTGASEFTNTLSLIRDKKYKEAAKEAGRGKRGGPSLWSQQTPERFINWSNRLSSMQEGK